MEDFLRGLIFDLRKRCLTSQQVLQSKAFPSDMQDYVVSIHAFLSNIYHDIQLLLEDPAFGAPQLLPNQLNEYKRLAQIVYLIESYPLPVITRYNEEDHQMFLLCKNLATQINYPLPLPIVSTFSREYYWSEVRFNLISVPVCESSFLLGLPDLCHELGHILFFHHERDFSFEFLEDLSGYIEKEKREVDAGRQPPSYKPFYEHIYALWKGPWIKEFASDMIATYLVGPAYAWTNMSLCSKMSPNIFSPGDETSHPADESRMRAIFAMLRVTRVQDAVEKIDQRWKRYIALTGNLEPPDYHLSYPDSLLTNLANYIYQACIGASLRMFTDQKQSSGSINIPLLLNEAWDVFLTSPESYSQWEANCVNDLRAALNR